MSGRLVSTALCTTVASSHPLLAEFELAAGDPAHVHQVIDQPHHLLQLPLDQRAGLLHVLPLSSDIFMICRALRIGASGLRSSWASVARNSSLRRSASRSAR